MVGGFVAPSGNNGFKLKSGKFRLLRFPGAPHTVANDTSDQGIIVGAADFDDANLHGYIRRNGAYETVEGLDKNNAFGTVLLGINSSYVVVGEFDGSDDFFHGFIHNDRSVQERYIRDPETRCPEHQQWRPNHWLGVF